MAYDLLTNISQDEDEQARFRARRKFQMDMAHDRIVSFREGELKGQKEGELKGRREGELKGRKEGELKGRADGILEAKLEDARNLLANGVSLEIITKSIGLSLDEIQSLAKR
jgi:predicted transposase/invertase (TIGR01784 family)